MRDRNFHRLKFSQTEIFTGEDLRRHYRDFFGGSAVNIPWFHCRGCKMPHAMQCGPRKRHYNYMQSMNLDWILKQKMIYCLVNHSIKVNFLIMAIILSLYKMFRGIWIYREVKVAQLSPTLCNPMDYTVHGIFQDRILEWVVFPFSRGSSLPREQTQVSYIAGRFFTSWATREAHIGPLLFFQHFFLA